MIRLLFIIILSAAGTSAWAGGRIIGNGADAVQCAMNGGVSYQLLDLYEGVEDYDYTYELWTENSSQEQILELALRRLEPFAADLSARLKLSINHIWQTRGEKWGQDFFNIPDEGLTIAPKTEEGVIGLRENCSLVQLAKQTVRGFYSVMRVYLNMGVWQQLGALDQAATLLHEALYDEALKRGATDSILVRHFVALLLSDQWSKQAAQNIIKLLKDMKFESTRVQGVDVQLLQVQGSESPFIEPVFFSNGVIKDASAVMGSQYTLPDGQVIRVGFRVQFHVNGQVKKLIAMQPVKVCLDGKTLDLPKRCAIEFTVDGRIHNTCMGR